MLKYSHVGCVFAALSTLTRAVYIEYGLVLGMVRRGEQKRVCKVALAAGADKHNSILVSTDLLLLIIINYI